MPIPALDAIVSRRGASSDGIGTRADMSRSCSREATSRPATKDDGASGPGDALDPPAVRRAPRCRRSRRRRRAESAAAGESVVAHWRPGPRSRRDRAHRRSRSGRRLRDARHCGRGSALQDDWPDLLAVALRAQSDLRIAEWAASTGLAPATVSRGFRAVFGLSPARYRAEMRARRAFAALTAGDAAVGDTRAGQRIRGSGASVARDLRDLTGAPPSAWRRASNPFKTTGMRPD